MMRGSAFVQLLLAGASAAQPAQRFEVAVIRPTAADATSGTSFNAYEGGRIRIVNEPVKLLIRTAFQLQNAQIAGGPTWLETDRYDIEAKTGRPEKPAPGTLEPYLQNMLIERFHLKFHREMRELTVWALAAAKAGPKLKVKQEGETNAMNTSGGKEVSRLVATAASMPLLARYIGNRLGAIVQDKTGLTDAYDFTLEWAPGQGPETTAPSLITALREQLGLRLESQKSPVEVLIIDKLERPSEN
jgi:uncharacterized protein (TIGR03435 family)